MRQGKLNSELATDEVKRLPVDNDARSLLEQTAVKAGWSWRSTDDVIRLARTAEDMDRGRASIGIESMRSAIGMHDTGPEKAIGLGQEPERDRSGDDTWGY
jgi:predicted ATPase with chaperone activity